MLRTLPLTLLKFEISKEPPVPAPEYILTNPEPGQSLILAETFMLPVPLAPNDPRFDDVTKGLAGEGDGNDGA